MIIPKLAERIIFGCDYNPEQWPEDVWHEDMQLMRRAGINLLSVGIFSWAKLQPDAKTWDFAWLDRILNLMAENEIYACLATATASPPAWLTREHPEILPVTREGRTLYPGSRQHYSPSSTAYREAAAKLVEQLVLRYKDHPALAAWHINNEYACHMPECHGEESTKRFRNWLQKRYKNLDTLNDAWGTAFWSQIYGDWDEILTPREAPYFSNPTQQLDFKRFTSDTFLELLMMEKKILRTHTPDTPITTNVMGFFKPLDYNRWAEEIDFTAWDSYPDPIDEKEGRQVHAAGNDLTRSLKPDQTFVLMEQATSAVNWRDINLPKRPGLNRILSFQTIARGGDGVMYFQWRASKTGTEKYHSAVIQHGGPENSRVFKEVVQLGADLKQLSELAGSKIKAEVAILFDWHSWWSLEVDSRPAKIDYPDACSRIHKWMYEKNIPVDFVAPNADLSRYKSVITPCLYIVDEACAQSLSAFVESGGYLLTTYFSGIVDENDHVQLGGYPAKLRKLLGLRIEEWHPYPEGKGNSLTTTDAKHFACTHWADVIHSEGATPLALFEEGFFKGHPAVTQHNFGKGFAFHLGTRPDEAGLDWVLNQVCCDTASIQPILETPTQVEASLRHKGEDKYLLLLNHSDQPESVDLKAFSGKNMLTSDSVSREIEVSPMNVSVIKIQS